MEVVSVEEVVLVLDLIRDNQGEMKVSYPKLVDLTQLQDNKKPSKIISCLHKDLLNKQIHLLLHKILTKIKALIQTRCNPNKIHRIRIQVGHKSLHSKINKVVLVNLRRFNNQNKFKTSPIFMTLMSNLHSMTNFKIKEN